MSCWGTKCTKGVRSTEYTQCVRDKLGLQAPEQKNVKASTFLVGFWARARSGQAETQIETIRNLNGVLEWCFARVRNQFTCRVTTAQIHSIPYFLHSFTIQSIVLKLVIFLAQLITCSSQLFRISAMKNILWKTCFYETYSMKNMFQWKIF